MSRIFVTNAVPREWAVRCGVSVAACNFSENLAAGGMFDAVWAVLPPFVRRVETFPGLVWSRLRGRAPMLAVLAEQVTIFRRLRRGDTVWYYNCTVLNALLMLLLMALKPGVRQYVIVLDFTPGGGVVQRLTLWLTNRAHGLIKLADSPLFTVRNAVCLPGVVPPGERERTTIEDPRPVFLLSGVLHENIAMTSRVLDAFASAPGLTLHVTGQSELAERYAATHDNIIYHGMVDYAAFLNVLHGSTFLLSTRDPSCPENQCNFPSKVIEALLHNRIVVSTIDYPQLEGIRYLRVDADDLAGGIARVAAMPKHELMAYANQAAKVRERFAAGVWADKIKEIEQCV